MARPIEPHLLARLGNLVTKWAIVEHWTSELFIFLTKGDPGLMLVVTANISHSTLATWIRTLNDIYKAPDDLKERIRELLADADELRAERNTLIHGVWHTGSIPDCVTVQTVRLERADIVRDLVVTAADLDDLTDRIIECGNGLSALLTEIGAKK